MKRKPEMVQEQENNIGPKAENKTICIIQLARIGDLIQTYIAAKGIRQKSETQAFKLILIARKKYADPIKHLLNECFDEVITLDYNSMVVTNQDKKLNAITSSLNEWVKLINKHPIHAVVNLTFSKTSGYLSSLINCPFKLGVSYDKENRLVIPDHWSQFVYSNVLTGPLNPFSLVDIFSKVIGTKPLTPPKKQKKENIQRIILHPFTSQEAKTWKPSKWSEVVFNLFKTTSIKEIKIVGSELERKRAEEILGSPLLARYKENIKNVAGKLNIEQLQGELEKADLFIGHDSMVGHLASLSGTQCVTVSLGTVRPVETAPYGDNNYVLAPLTNCYPCFPDQKCDHFKCHADIPYQAINTFLTNLISGNVRDKEVLKNVSPFHTSKLQIYKSSLESSGFFNLKPLIEHNLDVKQVFHKIYRIVWQFVLAETEETSDFPVISSATSSQLQNYQEGIKHLYQINEFGKKYSTYILQEVASPTPSIAKIKEYSKKIEDVDKLMLTIKEAYPLLSPVIDYFAVVKSNLEGENVVKLTENAYITYENSSIFCSVLNELIDKTISEHFANNNQFNKRE